MSERARTSAPQSGHVAGSGSRTSTANCVRQSAATVSRRSGDAVGRCAPSSLRLLTSPPPGARCRPSPPSRTSGGHRRCPAPRKPPRLESGLHRLLHSLPIVIDRQRSTSAGLLEVDLRCASEQRNRQERQHQTRHPGAKGTDLQRIVKQADAHGTDSKTLPRTCNHRDQRGSARQGGAVYHRPHLGLAAGPARR